jgi:hypothetical protein
MFICSLKRGRKSSTPNLSKVATHGPDVPALAALSLSPRLTGVGSCYFRASPDVGHVKIDRANVNWGMTLNPPGMPQKKDSL